MLGRGVRASRSVDYLLAVLSPLEIAQSTRAYLDSLPPNDVQALQARSVTQLDDDERAFLERSPDYATFLEQNRRALRTLDPDALRAILLPVITREPGDEFVSSLRSALPPPSQRQAWKRLREPLEGYAETVSRALRGTVVALAIAACGVAGLFAGLIGTRFFMSHPVHAITVPVVVAGAHATHHAMTSIPHHRIAHRAPPKRAVVARARARVTASRRRQSATRVARATTRRSRRASRPRPTLVAKTYVHASVAANTTATTPTAGTETSAPQEPEFVQRARLIVMSYLDSLMRGDASAALGNLGLSASAGTSNLTEAPILAGATEFHVVKAQLDDASDAKVQVVIDSPQGRFFGNYLVSANGPAAWITAHEVIPLGNRNI